MIMKAGRSKIYRVGWQPGEGEKLMLQFQPEGRPQAEPLLLWEISDDVKLEHLILTFLIVLWLPN